MFGFLKRKKTTSDNKEIKKEVIPEIKETIPVKEEITPVKETIPEKKEIIYDSLMFKFVPKIVDTNPEIFKEEYWTHSDEQVKEFLKKLPEEYKGNLIEKKFEKSKTILYNHDQPAQFLTVSVFPEYKFLDKEGKEIICPTFQVMFNQTNNEKAKTILKKGLEQFYFFQTNTDGESIYAKGIKNTKLLHSGLELLIELLPKNTTIDARTNYELGNAHATYQI